MIAALRGRIEAMRTKRARLNKPRVFCAEWLDPIFCAGHWLPEMVDVAGGVEGLGRLGIDSVRIDWAVVWDYAPEVVVLMPCGFDAEGALNEARYMTQREGWGDVPAVRNGRVYVVDANAYFARPGPRLVDGVEILARLIHPEAFEARCRTRGPTGSSMARQTASRRFGSRGIRAYSTVNGGA